MKFWVLSNAGNFLTMRATVSILRGVFWHGLISSVPYHTVDKIVYVCCNMVARSRSVYTSWTIQTSRYHFARRERCYGDLMSPATIKRTCVVMQNSRYFYPILSKFGVFRQIRLYRNPASGSRADSFGRTDKKPEVTLCTAYANAFFFIVQQSSWA